MRGLKLYSHYNVVKSCLSHLLQMRGLKHERTELCKSVKSVASFTDAWIETVKGYTQIEAKVGRIFYRCVDWNTHEERKDLAKKGSHLLQMRGLKQFTVKNESDSTVASFTDAWIETPTTVNTTGKVTSHLLQMRGLKHVCRLWQGCVHGRIFYRCVDWNLTERKLLSGKPTSHLLQMRGLKHYICWKGYGSAKSHLLQMRGLKPDGYEWDDKTQSSHLLQMRGLKL